MLDVSKIRQDFPILSRKVNGKTLIYLDNAATSQKPKPVIQAIVDYYEHHNANVHRGIHTLGDEATRLYHQSRDQVAKFIGADTDELIFVRNATEAINLVTWTWAFDHVDKDSEIILTEMEHHSNFVPWLQLSKSKGVKLQLVTITKDGRLDLTDLEAKLSPKTKLVAIVHCSNALGTINPIADIVKRARRVGAKVLVDAAQSVPHLPVNVKALGIDFLAFSGHKMLGPMGIGGLFIKRARQEEMGPFLTGGGMISEVYSHQVTWQKGPEKFEAGTPNVAGAVGLASAAAYLTKLGLANIRHHEKELVTYALARLQEVKDLTLLGPTDPEVRGGVVAFTVKGIHAHDVAQVLDRHFGIAVRSGHHCTMPLHQKLGIAASTRASFYIYNTKEEIDHLIEGLTKVKQIFQ